MVEAFLGAIPDGMQVNHINGIKTDNRIENLEIVTCSENVKHAYRIGLAKPSDNGFKKHVDIMKGGEKIASYRSIREMCRQNGFDRRCVARAIKGEMKTYKGYTFAI